jgi:phospholipase/carboxylesterase
MVVTRREFLAAGVLAPAVSGLSGGPSAPWAARQAAGAIGPGQHPLKLGSDRDGLVYIPRSYNPATPAPLLLMFHGAGNTSLSVAYTFPLADELGVVILAPDSRDEATWDGVLRNWGPDVEFIGEAFQQTLSQVNVNRQRVGVGGFSDGASYSLGFGISYGDQFTAVISMSPGVMQPIAARGKPRIFISHGTADPIMPIDVTSRVFVPRLRKLGYDVTYREYDGRHAPSPPIVREAFEWFLRPAS